ncbi:MAG: hypothetical protein ABIH26_04375 [Candidatus Eisenbacteria bacterium]
MKIRAAVTATLGVLAFAALVAVGSPTAADGPWIDMERCAACAPYMAEPGLMQHAQMESYAIATGMASITTVPAQYETALTRAEAGCNVVFQRAQSGEKVALCDMCSDLVDLGEKGAKFDQLDTKAGHIMAVTATDPALIKKIHTHVERTNAEMKKMMEKPKASY